VSLAEVTRSVFACTLALHRKISATAVRVLSNAAGENIRNFRKSFSILGRPNTWRTIHAERLSFYENPHDGPECVLLSRENQRCSFSSRITNRHLAG
jgi:hypothetical protein